MTTDNASGADDSNAGDDRPPDPTPPGQPPRGAADEHRSPTADRLTLHDVAEGLIALGRTVTELAAQVEDLQANAAAAPWWNHDALNPDDASRLRGKVHEFGEYLRRTYAITALPHRWTDDPALQAEISALYVGWIGAYHEPRATTAQPLQWHEALARGIDRIRSYEDRRRQRDSVDGRDRPSPSAPAAYVPSPRRDD